MKQKLQNLLKHNWRTLLLLLTLITTSQGAWAWLTISHREYFDASKVASKWNLNTSGYKMYMKVCYGGNCNSSSTCEMNKVSGSNHLYYTDNFKNHDNISHIQFYASNGSSSCGIEETYLSGWSEIFNNLYNSCWDSNNTSECWKARNAIKTPPLTTVSIDKYNTSTICGSGTQADPYIVLAGTKIQVQASCTKDDNNIKPWYSFKIGSGSYSSYSYSTTQTEVVASAVVGTTYSAIVQGKGCDSTSDNSNISVNSRESSTVHFKTVYSPYVIKGLDSWDGIKEFNSSGNYTYTANSNGYVEFKLQPYDNDETWYGSGQKMRLGLSNTISGTSGGNCKLYVQNGITYTFHYDGKDASNYPIITITPSAQSVSSNIYIKGPLRDASCWDGGYDNTAFDKEGSGNVVFTKIISAKNSSCDGAGAEFTLSAATDNENDNILNGRYIFVADGASPAWSYSDRSGEETNFKYTSSYSANDNLLITVTWDNTNKRYKMKVAPSCSVHPTIENKADGVSDKTLQGAKIKVTVGSSASGTCTPLKVGLRIYSDNACSSLVQTATEQNYSADGDYQFTISGLDPGVNYWYKGYVTSSKGENVASTSSTFQTVACTAPSNISLTNQDQTKCKGINASSMEVSAEGGVTSYSYEWKQNTSKSTTGAVEASGSSNTNTYTPPTSTVGTMYYYCIVKSATPCSSHTNNSDYATIVTNATPTIDIVPTGTVKNYTPVTISSDVDDIQTWSSSPVANDESVYFYDKSTSSAKFKASVARGSNETYTITGTTSNDCSGSKTVTVTKDTGTCE